MKRLLVAAVLVGVIGGAACSTNPGEVADAADPLPSRSATVSPRVSTGPTADAPSATTTTPRTTAPSSAATDAEAPVPTTLRFAGTTVDGESFDGSSLRGRPVLLWFWAPWCPTCRGQLPTVEVIAEAYRGDVSVIGVGSLDSASAIRDFVARDGGAAVHLVDERGSIWKHFEVTEQSSFVLLDAEGTVAFRSGYGGSDDIADRVSEIAAR